MKRHRGEKFAAIDTLQVQVLLAKRGWKISDLARALDEYPQTVWRVIQGGRPRSPLIIRIASSLEVPVHRILVKSVRRSRDQKLAA